ncbi:LacI family transcriptional regulator [Devosia yakushimensis]|uniref:LacI family transcriptional regulator n=1 Tax=Devosia yakushimensis TaxID=470028 RepID=A0ABQ5UEV8_9HYPH|nr:LacI family DNA-binding transcriptional regulator [Devosia yakushimensis]GLQ10568.1 LacI family transcriptional regulator [Devosia yakushimensis]
MSKTEERTAGPSIADVAREAGVATSTVSRALTKPGRIAEPTRLKVEAAARKLGYTVNQTARNLRVGQTRTVMIVLPEALYMGASQTVLEGLDSVARTLTERGYHLLIANVSRDASTDEHIVTTAFGGTICGIILMATLPPKSAEFGLSDAGLPIVSLHFDQSAQGIPSVISNDRAAISEAVTVLIDMGHRRFVYIGGRADNYHEIQRVNGVSSTLASAGLQAEALHVLRGDFNFRGGVRAALDYLQVPVEQRATAVVCANDDTAIGFIKTVLDAGLDVPGDVSVIGFDGAPVGAFMVPSLSTIQQSTTELGQYAADLLIRMVEGESIAQDERIEVQCQLTLRQSVREISA